MSVRQQLRRDPKTGRETLFWLVDVKIRNPEGGFMRKKKVPRVQTRRAAEQCERQLLGELLSDRSEKKEVPVPERKNGTPTVKVFAERFMSNHARVNNKPSEIETKQMILDLHIIPELGNLHLDEVGAEAIDQYKGKMLTAGLTPKTVNNHLIVLRCLLGKAEEWNVIAKVPKVNWLKAPEPDFDFLTFEEAEILLAAAEGEWLTMIATGMKAGLRQGELLALRWRDVDFMTAKINVRRNLSRKIVGTPKGHESRSIDASPMLLSILRKHRHLRGELVFCDQDGSMLTKNMCRRPLYDICKRAGLRQIGWHVLRHTFASHLTMRGVPLKVVQELLGHKDIKTTMRYAHLMPQTRQEAVALLDAAAPRGATQGPQSSNWP